MMKMTRNCLYSVLLFGMATGCQLTGDKTSPDGTVEPFFNLHVIQKTPQIGQTVFVSADGVNGQSTQENTEESGNNVDTAAPQDAGADDSDARSVEEGDIYRVLSGSDLILNLNHYRGLQVIDFSDPTDPEIIGRVQVSGSPVEMYQVEGRVYALVNNWQGYYGVDSALLPDSYSCGLVVAIDIRDPRNPKITGRAQVPGWIRTSRLTRGNGQEALFVVANDWS